MTLSLSRLGDNLADVLLLCRRAGRSARSSTVPSCITGMTWTCRTSSTSGRRRCEGGRDRPLTDEDVSLLVGQAQGSWVSPSIHGISWVEDVGWLLWEGLVFVVKPWWGRAG